MTVLALLPLLPPEPRSLGPCGEDVRYAIHAIEQRCGALLRAKGIPWRTVTAPLLKDAEAVRDATGHGVLLQRLLARLRDGHAVVVASPDGGVFEAPGRRETGPGMYWCRIRGRLHIKNAWGEAERAGLSPGMEVVEVNGQPALRWLERRSEQLADTTPYSTARQAFFSACHWGLAAAPGTKLTLVLRTVLGERVQRELTYVEAAVSPRGPAFFPKDLKVTVGPDAVRHGFTGKGWGYIHVRRCRKTLPEDMDAALADVGSARGLILDLRANGGGSFDHHAFMGRFIPTGKVYYSGGGVYESAGPHPYGGPIVAIIDAGVRSAGETTAGLFKDDGRGYVIGESATAGTSSQKTTIELPSGLFSLYVSVGTNMPRYNDDRGLEGKGVSPHRFVEYDPADLDRGIDTLTRTAEELLEQFPQRDVRYDPRQFGWTR